MPGGRWVAEGIREIMANNNSSSTARLSTSLVFVVHVDPLSTLGDPWRGYGATVLSPLCRRVRGRKKEKKMDQMEVW